jgi:hypothetical protein
MRGALQKMQLTRDQKQGRLGSVSSCGLQRKTSVGLVGKTSVRARLGESSNVAGQGAPHTSAEEAHSLLAASPISGPFESYYADELDSDSSPTQNSMPFPASDILPASPELHAAAAAFLAAEVSEEPDARAISQRSLPTKRRLNEGDGLNVEGARVSQLSAACDPVWDATGSCKRGVGNLHGVTAAAGCVAAASLCHSGDAAAGACWKEAGGNSGACVSVGLRVEGSEFRV